MGLCVDADWAGGVVESRWPVPCLLLQALVVLMGTTLGRRFLSVQEDAGRSVDSILNCLDGRVVVRPLTAEQKPAENRRLPWQRVMDGSAGTR